MYAKLIYAFGQYNSYRLETDDTKLNSICQHYTDVKKQEKNEKLYKVNETLERLRSQVAELKATIKHLEQKPVWERWLNINRYKKKREKLYTELKELNNAVQKSNDYKNHLENSDSTLMFVRFATKHLKEHGYQKIKTVEKRITTEYWDKRELKNENNSTTNR